MSGIWGRNLQISLFGESHGEALGVTIHGLPSGVPIEEEAILLELARRAPGQTALTTARKEADTPHIVSGLFMGKTTGAPLTAIFYNTNTRSRDYSDLQYTPRPGHADFPSGIRYQQCQDYRGGGHFSGRVTVNLVFAGAIAKQFLARRGVMIGAHIYQIGAVQDVLFTQNTLSEEVFRTLHGKHLPVLTEGLEMEMANCIQRAKAESDSVGGQVEVAAIGLPVGLGDPFFESMESRLAQLLFSVPAVKGLEFGTGFALAGMRGSEANDPYAMENGRVVTTSNHNGGLLGGLTTGMPLVYRVAIKPTASIGKTQETVDLRTHEDTSLTVVGRHDPCIVPRVIPVLEAVTALAILDAWLAKDGYAGRW